MTQPNFVIDASVILAWFNPNEQNDYADEILDCLSEEIAIIPQLCCLEVNNVFLSFEKKRIISAIETEKALCSLANLPITLDKAPLNFQMPLISRLARDNGLTIYDACYLELAVRLNLPLSTLDKQLLAAMEKIELPLKAPKPLQSG
jgi:predicted nucleic acid-binding protein